jgi:hypothetical protein
MLTILNIAELKLLTHGIINDTAEASSIGRNLVNPQLVLVFCREFGKSVDWLLTGEEKAQE